ncbi:3618_t:CDS:1 [Funneliformis mosseae]|uniref:3618_t:CDS:1 n=1 Tax=Funneliformis mosseae TaxID=27381 RepID=A0A9N8W8R8_FUNMO|nr:3618_t:CDS:1 [Funneliformis mosseae]
MDNDLEDDNLHTEGARQLNSRPLNEMIYQKLDKQTSELECLCERIKNLEIQRTNAQTHHHVPISSKESLTAASAPPPTSYISPINLPPIGELKDYQSIIRRIEELERNSILANHELGRLRRENFDLNEKIPLLVQVEVKKFKKEIMKWLSNSHNTNDIKIAIDLLNPIYDDNNIKDQDDVMNSDDTSYPSNLFESKPQRVVVPPPPEPQFQKVVPSSNYNYKNYNTIFENLYIELQNTANELCNDRDSFRKKMNSLRDMYN